MTRAYYNENDEFAADWLRNLIKAGLIANGEVDTRSIVDVRPGDLAGFGQCHFFAGIGGWSYALRAAGWPDDIAVWTGSCPCQPFSLAGKQKGFADERHLWPVWRELIRECNPAIVFGEQVASATEWLGLVRSDLEAMGRAVGAMPVQAASAGADHLRDRYWFVAYANDAGSQGRRILSERAGQRAVGPDGVAYADQFGASEERSERSGQLGRAGGDQEPRDSGNVEHAASITQREQNYQGHPIADARQARPISGGSSDHLEWVIGADGKARRVKSGVRLLAHGIPNRVGLLRGFGNAIDHRPANQLLWIHLLLFEGGMTYSHSRPLREDPPSTPETK